MHNHAIAVPDRREGSQVSPIIAGGIWLGDDDLDQPLVLQLRLPVSEAELAAALYDDDHLCPADQNRAAGFMGTRRTGDYLVRVRLRLRCREVAVCGPKPPARHR